MSIYITNYVLLVKFEIYLPLRIKIVSIGLAITICAILLYIEIPGFFDYLDNMFTVGHVGSLADSSLLSQMGIPPMKTMVMVIQYSSVGLELVGIVLLCFGMVAKKSVSQFARSKESDKCENTDNQQKTPRALSQLKERLAMGQITPSEFEELSKLL